jgi:hypothetical protein
MFYPYPILFILSYIVFMLFVIQRTVSEKEFSDHSSNLLINVVQYK